MRTQLAPVAIAPMRARYPQWRPITSTTNVRWWLAAVEAIASTASVIRCSAVSVPIVMSVPDMSLSIEPTRPTMLNGIAPVAVSPPTRPDVTSSSTSDGHSWRSTSAPLRLPSPPITTRLSIPARRRFSAAWRRPSRERKRSERAVPMAVPP
jgi:hypothetical protein